MMQEKLSVALSGKDASKLLEGLAKDPQLRTDDGPSVLVEEQFPSRWLWQRDVLRTRDKQG
jgi:hypothetical protein